MWLLRPRLSCHRLQRSPRIGHSTIAGITSLRLIMLRTCLPRSRQWTDAHARLAGRVSHVVRARNRTTPERCEGGDLNLLRRSWYFDYLKHAHPGLMDRSTRKIDPYVEILKQWERDPAAFARSQELTQRISMAFLEMIQSIVRNEIKVAPVTSRTICSSLTQQTGT